MQPCFFYLSGVVPQDQAVDKIKHSVETAYGKRGRVVVERNFTAIDAAVAELLPARSARGGHVAPCTGCRRCRPRRRTSSSRSPPS